MQHKQIPISVYRQAEKEGRIQLDIRIKHKDSVNFLRTNLKESFKKN